MPDGRVVNSLSQVSRDAWDALFPAALEGYDYLVAVEDARLDGFEWRYVLVEDEGRLVAAAPAFLTDYALDTTLDGVGRKVAEYVGKVAPGLTRLRLACLGSPCTEILPLGMAPDASPAQRQDYAQALLSTFETLAGAENCGLVGLKDISDRDRTSWASLLAHQGFSPVGGMPGAELLIDFDTVDGYLAKLSAATRKDMRRKLRTADGLRIEVRHDLSGLEDQVMALYAETLSRSDLQFETLTAGYFTGVLRQMGERALCVLYFDGDDQLLAANLLLAGDGVLLDKFFCMAAAGQQRSLYFISWFTNVRLCLERGLTRYDSGQASYDVKRRLGCRLQPATLYFRHRNPLLNRVLRTLAPLLSPAPKDMAA